MNNLKIRVFTLCSLFVAGSVFADWKQELRELKEICEEGLLSESECSSEREKILIERDAKKASNHVEWFCNYDGEHAHPVLLTDEELNNFSESNDASAIVRELLDISGLVPNFLVTPANVPNASAEVRGGERFIRYNPQFLAQAKVNSGTNWSVYAVMAHEIGHHLQGHTIKPGGSRPPIELEADEWSGWALGKLGASLRQAKSIWSSNPNAPGSSTHPAARDRLSAIEKGWKRARQDKTDPAPQPVKPVEQPKPQKLPTSTIPQIQFVGECVVNGEHALIGSDNNLYNSATRIIVARRGPASMPGCSFMIFGISGSQYCVNFQNQVFSPAVPYPVGSCR
ncbi:MAG: hypothetical protein K6L74_13760 [Neptuniibacter sp.]